MSKKVSVNLHGAEGVRKVDITPKAFGTRHIPTGAVGKTPPPTLTPDPPKPEPVIPAFNTAWKENRQRVLDFLAYGFCGNLSEGVVMSEFGDAVTAEYAPRKQMTAEQWRDLTADLQLSKWGYSHWIRDLRTRIWKKYEDRRYKNLMGGVVRVVRVLYAPADNEYPERVLFQGVPDDDFDVTWQAYCDEQDVSVTIYTDSTGKNRRYILPTWTYTHKLAGCTRCGDPACDGVSSTGVRCGEVSR